jgi:hypothetical protein
LTVSPQRQLQAAQRELAYRHRVYPRLIEAGRISAATAREEIAAMAAIVETLRSLAPQRSLFEAERDP